MAFFLQVVAGEYRFGNFNRLGRAVTIEADGTLNLQTHYQDPAVGITLNGGTLTASGASSRFVTSAAGLTSTGGGDVKFTGAGASTAYLQLGGNVAYNAGAPNKALVFTDGELRLGAATRTFTVADGAQAIDVDVQAQITGTDVGIIKDGLGTMRLGNGNGNHTYTGPTTVNAGTLIVQGNIASSSLTTVNGGTLMGDGTVGALDLNGGVLAPGNSVGQLDAGNTTWDNFDYEWEINSVAGSAGGPTGWDLLDVTGTLDVGSGIEVFVTSLTLAQAPGNVSDFDPLQSYIGIWNIATASGGVNNFSASDFTLNFSQWTGPAYTGTWSVSTDANNVYVNYTAGGPVSLVPEPSTVFLWLSGGLALWSYRRRRA
jgi:autotransporter-associated beta strand protein